LNLDFFTPGFKNNFIVIVEPSVNDAIIFYVRKGTKYFEFETNLPYADQLSWVQQSEKYNQRILLLLLLLLLLDTFKTRLKSARRRIAANCTHAMNYRP